MRPRSERGFTLVETLVASSLLIIAILGVAELVAVANRQTGQVTRRNTATNIARRVAEAARSTPGGNLNASTISSVLQQAAPDLPNSSNSSTTWTVVRQNLTYTIATSVCTVDDPGDGIGAHDSSFCTNATATSPPDPQPADYQRVTVTVSWPRTANGTGPGAQVREVTDVPMGASGNLPVVNSVAMQTPFACTTACPTITSQTTTAATFAVTAANSPASMTWLLDDNAMATCPPTTSTCSGSANSWAFTWNLGTVVKNTISGDPNNGLCMPGNYVYDGIHQVGARTADANGLSGASSSISVTLNRCQALPPPGFDATGRNTTTPVVDTEWQDNPEGDIVGYRVYRATTATNRVPVCPASVSTGQVIPVDSPNECVDPAPPAYSTSPLYYAVYAVDRDPSGLLREGAVSYTNVNTGNRPPNAPTSFAATKGTSGVTLTWTLPSPQDPDSGDYIDSFRIYRKSGTVFGTPVYTDRYDREALTALCSGSTCSFVDTATGGTTHTYWVTSVDSNLRESSYTTGKSA
jgi:type II secretory pathway pseudopilin PulG